MASVIAEAYKARIANIHYALGIPPDYGQRRCLCLQTEASDLIAIGTDIFGRVQYLEPRAAARWLAMRTAAQQDGIVLEPVSGFRSVAYQQQILERKLAQGQSISEILRVNAAPGYSEHHTGCALDLHTPGYPPLSEAFEDSAAFSWLWRNGPRFGFTLSYPRDNRHGVCYEPWHWAFGEEPGIDSG